MTLINLLFNQQNFVHELTFFVHEQKLGIHEGCLFFHMATLLTERMAIY